MPLATRTAAQRVQWDIHRATINLIQSFTADVSIVAQGSPPGAPNDKSVSTTLAGYTERCGQEMNVSKWGFLCTLEHSHKPRCVCVRVCVCVLGAKFCQARTSIVLAMTDSPIQCNMPKHIVD